MKVIKSSGPEAGSEITDREMSPLEALKAFVEASG
jgi:hypothetical protein